MQYIDLSFVTGAIIALMILVAMKKVWPIIEAFIPPVALGIINWFADVVVNAVESEYASGQGEEKRAEAFKRINKVMEPLIDFVEQFGFTISSERIYEAIQSAWQRLNTAQIQSGEKAVVLAAVPEAQTYAYSGIPTSADNAQPVKEETTAAHTHPVEPSHSHCLSDSSMTCTNGQTCEPGHEHEVSVHSAIMNEE